MKTIVLHYNASLAEAIYSPDCDGPGLDELALEAAKTYAAMMHAWATENFPDYRVDMSNDWGVIGANDHVLIGDGEYSMPEPFDGYEDPALFSGLEDEEDRLLVEIAMAFGTDHGGEQ